MKNHFRPHRLHLGLAAVLTALVVAMVVAAGAPAAKQSSFTVHYLVSDVPGMADHTDPNLVNSWGLAALPTSPWWVADNGTSKATIYMADGTPVPLVVSVPSAPTGEVANAGSGFVVHEQDRSGPARFLFATEEGKILGWNPDVAPDHAVVAADLSSVGTIYKGLAIASTPKGDFLYAADFHNGRVDMFDTNFNLVNTPGAFLDRRLPDGFAPFGIQTIGKRILVSYAKQDADRHDDVPGPGLGFVDAYSRTGRFLGRLVSHGMLNAPWGLAPAPAGFGPFGGDLLVGNFGDGHINAYQPRSNGSFKWVGTLSGADSQPIMIDGLWALEFGKGDVANNGPTSTLFFTAGPDEEMHGLFGTIEAK